MATIAELLSRHFRRTSPNLDELRLQYQWETAAEQERRAEAAESRRESERRWYARLPIMAIATLAVAVVVLTGLLVVASHYADPPASKDKSADTGPPPKKEATPPSPGASVPSPVSIQMKLSSKALFGYNSSELRVVAGSAQRTLDSCLERQVARVHVIGHADCIGSDDYNKRLSERRALAVRRYLIAKGIDAAVITSEGQGSTLAKADPLCAGSVRPTPTTVSQLEPFRRVDVTCEYTKQVPHGTFSQSYL